MAAIRCVSTIRRCAFAAFPVLLWATGSADAHEAGRQAAGNSGVLSWAPVGWSSDPWVLLPMAMAAAVYAAGLARLWRQAGIGHGISRAQALFFAGGWSVLAVAMVTPLDGLGAYLFSAHMVQHELMMLAAAPLLVLGRPLGAWTWAFAPSARQAIGRSVRAGATRRFWHALTHPLSAWTLHALALWGWHAPAMFDLATRNAGVHILQHASFLGSALLFWWAVLGGDARLRSRGPAMLLVFTTLIHTAALGALLTLAPHALYPSTAAAAASIGVDALEDQQLGGLIMWVPGSVAYLAAGLWAASRLLMPQARSAPVR